MARPTPQAVNEPFRQPRARVRACDVPGCPESGNYRAPKSRTRLDDYYWFCLDHVRDYNAAWDYFSGLSEDEIEAIRRNDTVWQRPSWPLNKPYNGAEAELQEQIRRMFDQNWGPQSESRREQAKAKRPQSEADHALAVLGLEASASFTEIKSRYKKLAKQLHPDANGDSREAEERLKAVNQAYSTLKKSFA